jgi:CBS domain-containing protein
MNIASICQRDIVTVDADASLRDAAVLMRDHHVGALVVTEGEATPGVKGVVTDRDLAIEVLALDLDPAFIRIGELATGTPVAVAGSGSLQDAVALMEEHGVRRLLVTAADGGVIGFLSADDLVDAMAAEVGGLARALRAGIARETAERPAVAPRPARAVFLPQGMPGMQ